VAARVAGVPIVLSVHNLMYEPEIRIDNPRFSSFKQQAFRAAERLAVRVARPHVIAVSDAVRRSVLAHLSLASERVTVIHNGVDLKAFSPPSADERAAARARLGVPAGVPVVAAVGRFVALKGHHYLLEAMSRLRVSHPQAHLLLAGAGPLQGAIETLAAKLGLADAVRFLGPHDDVREVIAAADVLAAPSLSEGFGLSVVEAMAMAVPVVASRTGGFAEIVDDGHSGLLVPPRDPNALATALAHLLDDANLRRRVGAQGRATAEARFDVRASARAIERIYERALAARVA
jgi:glycosyltransferase involved in cell wall biosynthesis